MNSPLRHGPPPPAATTGGGGPWRIGSLTIAHGLHPPNRAAGSAALVLIPLAGTLTVQQGNLEHILRPPFTLLHLPAGAPTVRCSGFHGWRIRIDSMALCRAAGELVDHRVGPARIRRQLGRMLQLCAQPGKEREGMALLLKLLDLCRQHPPERGGLAERIGLAGSLERLLALQLCAELLHSPLENPAGSPRDSRAEILEQLLEWIRSHQHRPIQLEELAQVSGYSQRSLRNLFQERFGCSPVQWIRRERLTAARDQLLSPAADTTVSAVAASVGYRHLSQFSRDFQQCHGRRPSEVLREGLRQCG